MHTLGVDSIGDDLPAAAARDLFDRLRTGRCDPPRISFEVSHGPPEQSLDDTQRDALGRAVRSPDVFLVQGQAGTGKTMWVAELTRRLARAGETVLLYSPSASALAVVREAIAGTAGVTVRDHTEPPTAADRLSRDPSAVVEQLAENLAAWDRVTAQLAAIDDKRAKIADDVQRQYADRPMEPEFRATLDSLAKSAEAARAEARVARSKAESLRAELADLRPMLEARQANRWWTGAFWKSTSGVAARAAEIDAELDRLDQSAAEANRAADDADRRRAELKEDDDRRLSERRAAEVQRRSGDLDEQKSALERERAALRERWIAAFSRLSAASLPPEPSAEGVTQARAVASSPRPTELPTDAQPDRANVVAVTPAELPQLADTDTFDRLVIDDAQLLTEADFLAAARRAGKWVLVGETPPREPRAADGKTPPVKPFAALWSALHRDVWTTEGDRIICRLREVPPERRPALEIETVADRPEIELRIDAPPDGTPQLAEVVFPAGTDLGTAKAFIFLHLDETPIPVCGEPCWVEEAGRLMLRMHGHGTPATVVELQPGVREWIAARPEPFGRNGHGPLPWYTSSLEFDPAEWPRERAEQWVRHYLGRHDLGRTAKFERVYRYAPAVARAVAEWFPPGELVVPDTGPAGAVEFVPVPAVPPPEANGRRIGAGLEVIGPRGVENREEAKAVVEWCVRHEAGPIAVMALTAAQTAVIGELIAARPGLTGRVSVGTPEQWRHRDADTIVLSLTRSHVNRAVPYGDRPDWLPLALTRARRRLVVVGDFGSLAKRGSWDGPLPPHEPATAARERHLARKLAKSAELARSR